MVWIVFREYVDSNDIPYCRKADGVFFSYRKARKFVKSKYPDLKCSEHKWHCYSGVKEINFGKSTTFDVITEGSRIPCEVVE